MTDSELRKELLDLGLKENDFSIKLSNQFAYYHLRMGFNCYEVFCKDERGSISLKKEYETEQLGKKALIDLVRMNKGKKAKYNIIETREKLYKEQSRILELLKEYKTTDKEIALYNKFYDLVSRIDFKNYESIQSLSECLIDYGFSIDRKVSEEIFYFTESIII